MIDLAVMTRVCYARRDLVQFRMKSRQAVGFAESPACNVMLRKPTARFRPYSSCHSRLKPAVACEQRSGRTSLQRSLNREHRAKDSVEIWCP